MNAHMVVGYDTVFRNSRRTSIYLICKNYKTRKAYQIYIDSQSDVWLDSQCLGTAKFEAGTITLKYRLSTQRNSFEYALVTWAFTCINTRSIENGYEIGWNPSKCGKIYWSPIAYWENDKF